VPGTREYRRGTSPYGFLGEKDCYLGKIEWWQHGAPPGVTRADLVVPDCCKAPVLPVYNTGCPVLGTYPHTFVDISQAQLFLSPCYILVGWEIEAAPLPEPPEGWTLLQMEYVGTTRLIAVIARKLDGTEDPLIEVTTPDWPRATATGFSVSMSNPGFQAGPSVEVPTFAPWIHPGMDLDGPQRMVFIWWSGTNAGAIINPPGWITGTFGGHQHNQTLPSGPTGPWDGSAGTNVPYVLGMFAIWGTE